VDLKDVVEAHLVEERRNDEKAMGRILHQSCLRNYDIKDCTSLQRAKEEDDNDAAFQILSSGELLKLMRQTPEWQKFVREERFIILNWVNFLHHNFNMNMIIS